jgi:hypothetical protein
MSFCLYHWNVISLNGNSAFLSLVSLNGTCRHLWWAPKRGLLLVMTLSLRLDKVESDLNVDAEIDLEIHAKMHAKNHAKIHTKKTLIVFFFSSHQMACTLIGW